MNEVMTARGLMNHMIDMFRQHRLTKEDFNREIEFQKRNYPQMYNESLRIMEEMKKAS